jgi:hypothetical protein
MVVIESRDRPLPEFHYTFPGISRSSIMQISSQQIKKTLALILLWAVVYLVFGVRLSIALIKECWKRYNHHLAAALNTVVLVLADAFPPFELLQLRWWPSSQLATQTLQSSATTEEPHQLVVPFSDETAIANPWEEPLPDQLQPNGYPALKAPVSAVVALLPAALPIAHQPPTTTQPNFVAMTVRELRELA